MFGTCKKIFLRKLLFLGLISAVFSYGLFLLNGQLELFHNFEPYYLESYSFEMKSSVSKIRNYFIDFRHDDNDRSNIVPARAIPVLLYHGIISEADGANTTLSEFIEQMQALKQAGYQTVSMEDFYDAMLGKKALPDNSFLLTFDDGRKDSYYPVDPILGALGYRAVSFIITKEALETDIPFYLHESELDKMKESGRWDIEAHAYEGHTEVDTDASGTRGQFFASRKWLSDQNRSETTDEYRARVWDDLLRAREDLKGSLGLNPIAVAYPFGDFGQQNKRFPEARNILQQTTRSLFSMGFYQVRGESFSWNHPSSDPLLIKRIGVIPGWSGQELLNVLQSGRPKELPYSDDLTANQGWINSWGAMSFREGTMLLNATSRTNSSQSFLDGSYLWRDYSFDVTLDWKEGTKVQLLVRYQDRNFDPDTNDYAACDFEDQQVRVVQRLDGTDQFLSEVKNDTLLGQRYMQLSARVSGEKLECLVDGNVVASSDQLSPQPGKGGGIGIEFDTAYGSADPLIIHEVDVTGIQQDDVST